MKAPIIRICAASSLAFSFSVLAATTILPETKMFIDKASVANQFEIDTSKLALEYSKANDVKQFAQEMIDDHTKVGDDFKATLKSADIPLPTEGLDVAHQAKYAMLRLFTTEKGFDSSYVAEQLAAHEDAVKLFSDHAANDPTPAIKNFAAATLPKLEHHLSMVKDLSAKHQ
jgi:putative membrane protein